MFVLFKSEVVEGIVTLGNYTLLAIVKSKALQSLFNSLSLY